MFYFSHRYDFSDNSILKKISIFDPKKTMNATIRCKVPSLEEIIELLPRCVGDLDRQAIDNEWRSICHFQFEDDIITTVDVDIFWGKILKFQNENNVPLFQNLARFVLNILSLPHSNADCERLFSKVNNIKTKLRNRLKTDTTEKILLAKQCVNENGNCTKFKATKCMLSKMNSTLYIGKSSIDETEEIVLNS